MSNLVQEAQGTFFVNRRERSATSLSRRGATRILPYQYVAVLAAWALSLLWFEPRLLSLLEMADNFVEVSALLFFIVFVNIAWLYGFYNLGVILFAFLYRRSGGTDHPRANIDEHQPGVAILYTTCNDFVEESAASCVQQDYENYTVYLLDDSTDARYKQRVDTFASKYPELVKVVRRPNRKGYKAGNLNHALARVATQEPYFAIADADEILPPNFLKDLVPILEADPKCGFVQATHRSNPKADNSLAKALGKGIDIHWKWYQPLRNKFGFVMFLGHGAVLRRHCWEVVGGFPEIVSEDLAYAIRIREHGWRGRFAEDVVCYEDFPETIRAFRIRHMKWTRGTCEFLWHEMVRLLRSRKITWQEKCDILFPTLNLPLTLCYFLFMLDANIGFPLMFGVNQPVTFVVSGTEYVLPIIALDSGFYAVYSADFLLITLMTFFAPVLCFLIELARKPLFLFRFLCHSTAVYAALSPLSALGVASFLVSRRATFLVTGDNNGLSNQVSPGAGNSWSKLVQNLRAFVKLSHPDQKAVRVFEFATGFVLALTCIVILQFSFLGLTLAFLLMPLMHFRSWEHPVLRRIVYLPFILIVAGITLGSATLLGMQTTFFGYGFHF